MLCTIGDSTFTHSGMTPLIGAARADADMTVFMLDNAIVAMTGGQETMAAGPQLLELLKALGVPAQHLHVIEPLSKNHAGERGPHHAGPQSSRALGDRGPAGVHP